MAKEAAPKKKPVNAKQAGAVAAFLKQQKGNTVAGAPALPTPQSNPVATADDDQE
jgi:hypothetical protein